MSAFTLDTSGYVDAEDREGPGWLWSDLDLFTQGCGAAMAQELYERLIAEGWTPEGASAAVAFRDWAPSTLAAILKDCERAVEVLTLPSFPALVGEAFFRNRQRGVHPAFPPLTVSLDDYDCKLYLTSGAA